MDATTAPERGPSVLAEAFHPPRPAVSEAVAFHRPQPAASEAEAFHPPRPAVLEAEAFHRPQPAASEAVALPVLVVEGSELEVLDPAPQASRYSDSLFRQPRLISFLS